jgi:predicted enzyme related to lactoylglutathione lyase
MLKYSPFFAGIAVDDLDAAKKFYGDTLGVFQVIDIGPQLLSLQAGNGYAVLLYERPNHVPPEHTVLNFPVEDIELTVDRMHEAGVQFERYDDGPIATNEKGIAHPGPYQAWFKDPAGNILSVLQD